MDYSLFSILKIYTNKKVEIQLILIERRKGEFFQANLLKSLVRIEFDSLSNFYIQK